jgi:serine/threonine protein phosphatase 1
LYNAKGIMGREFVLGDIHGAYRALRQCLDRSCFDVEDDRLICLGDVCDGWPETRAAVKELLKIKNLVYILGNHDWWTLEWMLTGSLDQVWFDQGGKATIQSYEDNIPAEHLAFFSNAVRHHLSGNKLFVHAGIDARRPLERQSLHTLLWDRTFALTALDRYGESDEIKLTNFDEVYIGHTPVNSPVPIRSCEVWFMDTGAGWSGTLSMMDVETKEVFVSDPVPELYPGVEGRKRK